ncbi:hypothetical protein Peur_048831 [Populus x canadensis]
MDNPSPDFFGFKLGVHYILFCFTDPASSEQVAPFTVVVGTVTKWILRYLGVVVHVSLVVLLVAPWTIFDSNYPAAATICRTIYEDSQVLTLLERVGD